MPPSHTVIPPSGVSCGSWYTVRLVLGAEPGTIAFTDVTMAHVLPTETGVDAQSGPPAEFAAPEQ